MTVWNIRVLRRNPRAGLHVFFNRDHAGSKKRRGDYPLISHRFLRLKFSYRSDLIPAKIARPYVARCLPGGIQSIPSFTARRGIAPIIFCATRHISQFNPVRKGRRWKTRQRVLARSASAPRDISRRKTPREWCNRLINESRYLTRSTCPCPCLCFSLSLSHLSPSREKRYTCKRCGRACVYERARLYTYESRRISGHTTGAEISFIYPRLPASLLTVYPQHLMHHGRVVRAHKRARTLRVRVSTYTHRDSAGHPLATRYTILFALMNFFGGNSVRTGGMQTSLSLGAPIRRGSLNALAERATITRTRCGI